MPSGGGESPETPASSISTQAEKKLAKNTRKRKKFNHVIDLLNKLVSNEFLQKNYSFL